MTTAELNTPELRLPNPPGVFRRWLAAHPKLVDNTIVVTYLFGCALMIAFELMSGYATEVYTDIDPAAAAEMSANGAHPVSYTHLDVYKRQGRAQHPAERLR